MQTGIAGIALPITLLDGRGGCVEGKRHGLRSRQAYCRAGTGLLAALRCSNHFTRHKREPRSPKLDAGRWMELAARGNCRTKGSEAVVGSELVVQVQGLFSWSI